MPGYISSLQNPRIKHVVKLNARRYRDRQRLTAVEGIREVSLALHNGFIPVEAFICPDLLHGDEATAVADQLQLLNENSQTNVFTVSPNVFTKIAYRGESGGVLLVLPYWQRPLSQLPLSKNPFLVVIEGGEKPGNLGAVLRTADAAGVDAVIISENGAKQGTDIFNPNVIRASLGAIFTLPVITAETSQVIDWLLNQGIRIAATTPEGDDLYTAVNLQNRIALVLGSEAQGLSRTWLEAAHFRLVIPMQGQVDSLNLSVSTALMLYEVIRQRGAAI